MQKILKQNGESSDLITQKKNLFSSNFFHCGSDIMNGCFNLGCCLFIAFSVAVNDTEPDLICFKDKALKGERAGTVPQD